MSDSANHRASGGDRPAVNPWEERRDRGRVAAIAECIRLLATSPRSFFRSVDPQAGIRSPLLFIGLVGIVSVLANAVVVTVLGITLPEAAADLLLRTEGQSNSWPPASQPDMPFGAILTSAIMLQAFVLLLPVVFVLMVLVMLVFGVLVHLLLVVTRTPRPQGFRGTFAVLCYASATNILAVIPFAGDMVSAIAGAALFAIGIEVVHGVGRVRAAVLSSIYPLLALLNLVQRLTADSVIA